MVFDTGVFIGFLAGTRLGASILELVKSGSIRAFGSLVIPPERAGDDNKIVICERLLYVQDKDEGTG